MNDDDRHHADFQGHWWQGWIRQCGFVWTWGIPPKLMSWWPDGQESYWPVEWRVTWLRFRPHFPALSVIGHLLKDLATDQIYPNIADAKGIQRRCSKLNDSWTQIIDMACGVWVQLSSLWRPRNHRKSSGCFLAWLWCFQKIILTLLVTLILHWLCIYLLFCISLTIGALDKLHTLVPASTYRINCCLYTCSCFEGFEVFWAWHTQRW